MIRKKEEANQMRKSKTANQTQTLRAVEVEQRNRREKNVLKVIARGGTVELQRLQNRNR